MKKIKQLAMAVTATVLFAACSKDEDYTTPVTPPPPGIQSTVVSGSGDLTTNLTDFRNLIGAVLNTTPGASGGRREINWDGVPPDLTNTNTFPVDFFNSTDSAAPNGRKRGLVYASTGTAFRVDSTDFSDIDPSYADEFDAFSPKKSFAYLGTNITEVLFKVPGTNTDASVKGFGVIFSDVEDTNSTTMEFFNGIKSLGVFKAPVKSGSNFSFLGVRFPDEKITRVKITAGNAALGTGIKDISNGGTKDLVVMDDFFYDEPVPLQ
jgi:hypothetical protein